MLAFIGNLSFLEIALVAVVAVLVFGRDLPQVAGQVAGQVLKARRALANLRRETGIDEELRRAREVAYEATRPRPAPRPVAPDRPVTGPAVQSSSDALADEHTALESRRPGSGSESDASD